MQGARDAGVSAKDLDLFLRPARGVVKTFLKDLPVAGVSLAVLVDLMKYVVGASGAWFHWGLSTAHKKACDRIAQEANKDLTLGILFVACVVLQELGVGLMLRSVPTPGGGRPAWFFTKRPPTACQHVVLKFLGFHDDSTPSLEAYAASIAADALLPARAPKPDWDAVPLAENDGETLELLGCAAAAVAEDADTAAAAALAQANSGGSGGGAPEAVAEGGADADGGFGA